MEEKHLMTYALLSHLKETHNTDKGSLVKIFEPIVKKAIVEYSHSHGTTLVMGKNISEIQQKIDEFFGIEIPVGVLSVIIRQISDEINDDSIFAFHKLGSFIINSYIFNDLDEDINREKKNIEELQNDYKNFCSVTHCDYNFKDLLDFIFALKTDLFEDKSSEVFNTNHSIPTYLKLKLDDNKIFGIISDIYLGNILSSYFSMKINCPVTNTELLLDTNFFISLIDLNTEEAHLTCSQLYQLSKTLGFRFSILYSTVEQIKVLLNSRVQDFANKELGFIKEADIFGACIRRKLDKSQLERIKDGIDSQIRKFEIDIISESRIKPIVAEAQKSQKYKDLIEKRHGHKLSALNDAIAYYYVINRRGSNINEFADVKCWFLHNSYTTDYETTLGYKIHQRNTINANELLTLLWLTNPNQNKISPEIITKGGLATYIAKYRYVKMPSNELIKQINEKAKNALKLGRVVEKDIYSIGIRMSEGHLTGGEAAELVKMPDEQFISRVKTFTKQDEEIRRNLSKQAAELNTMKSQVEVLKNEYERLKTENLQIQLYSATVTYKNNRDHFVEKKLNSTGRKYVLYSFLYIIFVIIISH